jgi:hypothetical protein
VLTTCITPSAMVWCALIFWPPLLSPHKANFKQICTVEVPICIFDDQQVENWDHMERYWDQCIHR